MPKTATKKQLLVDIKSRKMLPKLTDEQFAAVANSVGLTPAELKEVHHLAYQTYQYIGSDLAEANGGKSMLREEIVEVVLDANYMEMANRGKITPKIRAWLFTKVSAYGLDVVYAAVAAGFPYPRYE